MSDYAPDGGAPRKDPLVRILAGCAIVFGGLIALVLVVGGIVGWRLTRDETPGRPEEAFLVGDEARYWCFDLEPDDVGLTALERSLEEAADEARREAMRGNPFASFLGGGRRGQLRQMLPMRLELALHREGGWSGRATFGRATLRIRAALKIIRWMITRDRNATTTIVDGIRVTSVSDASGLKLAFASVGNRLLAASDVEDLTGALRLPGSGGAAVDPGIAALHESIRREGEDGWAFGPGPSVASFDVDAHDDLTVHVVIAPGVEGPDPLAELRGFLPHVPEDALVVDPGSPHVDASGATWIEGRITGLADRLGKGLKRVSEKRERPSATPPPPSPPPSSDPRTGTPEGSRHGESPSPGR